MTPSRRRPAVLVVEDDEQMQDFYRRFFEDLHPGEFAWRLAADAKKALAALERHPAEPVGVVVLDLGLPGALSGLDFLRRVKADPRTHEIPVFVVSARGSVGDQVAGLEAGADDYLVKPFNPTQLWARLRVIFRREGLMQRGEAFEAGELRFEAATRSVRIGKREVHLEPKEFDLLQALLRRPNVVHSSGSLWESIWGYDSDSFEHVLHAKVSSLRAKLGPVWGPRVRSHKGQGYSLELPARGAGAG